MDPTPDPINHAATNALHKLHQEKLQWVLDSIREYKSPDAVVDRDGITTVVNVMILELTEVISIDTVLRAQRGVPKIYPGHSFEDLRLAEIKYLTNLIDNHTCLIADLTKILDAL
jgi:hypothetical protein